LQNRVAPPHCPSVVHAVEPLLVLELELVAPELEAPELVPLVPELAAPELVPEPVLVELPVEPPPPEPPAGNPRPFELPHPRCRARAAAMKTGI
jgi:hypothetical protein